MQRVGSAVSLFQLIYTQMNKQIKTSKWAKNVKKKKKNVKT